MRNGRPARQAEAGPPRCGSCGRPRVLLIGPYPEPKGGISIHVKRLQLALESRDERTRILDESRLAKAGMANLWRMPPWAYLQLLRGADIVHVHTGSPLGRLLHAIMTRITAGRLVITIHSFHGSLLPWLLSWCALQLAHRRIFVSQSLRTRLRCDGAVIPAFIGPSAGEEVVPAFLAQWIDARRREGRSVVVSNAFRLDQHDGTDLYGLDLLVALFEDADVRARFACVFVVSTLDQGAKHFHACAQRIARSCGEKDFILRGDSLDFAGIVKLSDVFIRATNTDGDALSVREAIWYGTTVLASDCVDRPPEALLFRNRDVADLKAKLMALHVPFRRSPVRRDFFNDIRRIYSEVVRGSTEPRSVTGRR